MEKHNKIFEIADQITKFNFEQIWKIEGESIINLKKKEIAEEMFFKGIAYILDHLETFEQIDLETVKKNFKEIPE